MSRTKIFARSGARTRNRKRDRNQAVMLLAAIIVSVLVAAMVLAGNESGKVGWLILAGAALVALVLSDPLLRPRDGTPVLTWHSVSRDAGWNPWAVEISVRPETLDRQLALLRRKGFQSMDSREFADRRRRGDALPPDTVVLHFDDGYLDNWIAAAPLLEHHGMVATLFVSLDFVAPDRLLPRHLGTNSGARSPVGADYTGPWDGYLSWREIMALDSGAFGGVFDVQPHGVDHGRVAISDQAEGRLTPENWRQLAWMQWAHTPGDKHDWYLAKTPQQRPFGTPVPASASALAARAWLDSGRLESQSAYESRVKSNLALCQNVFSARLSKKAEIFCWPQNHTSPDARRIAVELGYLATTGGAGRNAADEPADVISRLHVGERYAGFENVWIDDLAFYASVRCFQGNHYWYLVIGAVILLRAAYARTKPFVLRTPASQEIPA